MSPSLGFIQHEDGEVSRVWINWWQGVLLNNMDSFTFLNTTITPVVTIRPKNDEKNTQVPSILLLYQIVPLVNSVVPGPINLSKKTQDPVLRSSAVN